MTLKIGPLNLNSRSLLDPLKQKGTWIAIVLGALSILNTAKLTFEFELLPLLSSLDLIFQATRDFLLSPIDALDGFFDSAIFKNSIVIFGVISRASATSLSFILEELKKRPARRNFDGRYRTAEYLPLEQGTLAKLLGAGKFLSQIHFFKKFESITRQLHMFCISLFWPTFILSIWKSPQVVESIAAGLILPPRKGAGVKRGEFEKPPLDAVPSSKFPWAEREDKPIYNVRVILSLILLGQFFVAAILAALSLLLSLFL